jgi:hypothetical protein
MAAAMFVLAFALLVPFWLGALSADALLPAEMALMLPATPSDRSGAIIADAFARQEQSCPSGSAAVALSRCMQPSNARPGDALSLPRKQQPATRSSLVAPQIASARPRRCQHTVGSPTRRQTTVARYGRREQ